MTISLGDAMTFKLVSPDYNKGEDHTMNQNCAILNSGVKRLTHSVELHDKSVNIHSAQDDRLFFHSLEFSESSKDNGVRVALVCRWLRPAKFFRSWPQEKASPRYCTVDPDAYEQLKGYRHKQQWQNCLGDSHHQLDLLYNR